MWIYLLTNKYFGLNISGLIFTEMGFAYMYIGCPYTTILSCILVNITEKAKKKRNVKILGLVPYTYTTETEDRYWIEEILEYNFKWYIL